MVTIAKDRDLVTLINVFTVAPEDQQRLVDVLVEATEAVMRNQQGFISANIHSSFDGRRVTNYAQWRSLQRPLRLCLGTEKRPSTWGRRQR
jgi:hypothetical protein